MLFRITGTLLGILAFATSVAAQSTPPTSGVTRKVIAATKLLTVAEVPLYFRAASVTLPPGGKTDLSASSGILYQVSGSTEITFDKQARTLTSGEGSFIAAGRTTTLKVAGEAPSALLHFFLGPATDLDQPAYAAPATVRELYRTSAPIPGSAAVEQALLLRRSGGCARSPSKGSRLTCR